MYVTELMGTFHSVGLGRAAVAVSAMAVPAGYVAGMGVSTTAVYVAGMGVSATAVYVAVRFGTEVSADVEGWRLVVLLAATTGAVLTTVGKSGGGVVRVTRNGITAGREAGVQALIIRKMDRSSKNCFLINGSTQRNTRRLPVY